MKLKKCKLGLLVCIMAASILTPKSVAKAEDDTSGVLEYYTSFDKNEVTYNAGSFTGDYEACRQTLYAMECENKDADVYTNVSKAIDILNNIQDSSYKRIIIISDGIHQNELTIHSSYPEVKDRLKSDNELVRIVTVIENQPCDGSLKNARLNLGDVVFNCDVRLPVVEYVPEETEETESVEETVVEKEKASLFNPLTIVLLVAVIVVLIVVVILLILLKKKGNTEDAEKEYKKLDNQIKNERYIPEPEKKGMPAGATPIINKEPMIPKPADNNMTQDLFQNPYNPSKQPAMNQPPVNQPVVHRISLQNVEDPSKVFSGSFQDKLTIGRNPGSVQIVIPDSAISGVHCEIGIIGNKFYIEDLKSSNGSFVNGTRCLGATEIKNGCQIKLGRTIFILRIE